MPLQELCNPRSEAFKRYSHPVFCKRTRPASFNQRGPDGLAKDVNPVGTCQDPLRVFASLPLLSLRQGFLEGGEHVGVKRLAEACHAAGYEAYVNSKPGAMS